MCYVFFFNDTATTEIYTLSLHDALPISSPRRSRGTWARSRGPCRARRARGRRPSRACTCGGTSSGGCRRRPSRSEEHTSELQSRLHLVCRLLLEKKKETQQSQQDYDPKY